MFGIGEWRRAFEALSFRVSSLQLDISAVSGKLNRRDTWLLETFSDINKRLDKLEKENKKLQQLLHVSEGKRLSITVTNCNK